MRIFTTTIVALTLAGCAEQTLISKEKAVLPADAALVQPTQTEDLASASKLAYRLSGAYFQAATTSQTNQDAASALVILTAASVVAGAVKGVSDTALANRGLAAVGVQQVAQRGLNKTTIESIYDGAQIFNCIGVVTKIYENDDILKDDDTAVEITLAVMREVRINVRKGFTRDVADYSAVIGAFKAVIEGGAASVSSLPRNAKDARQSNAEPAKLEIYLTRLGGCVSEKQASQSKKP